MTFHEATATDCTRTNYGRRGYAVASNVWWVVSQRIVIAASRLPP